MSVIEQMGVVAITGAICIFALFLLLLWHFIKSAVREGTKEAIYAALLETGIAKPKYQEPINPFNPWKYNNKEDDKRGE